MPILDLLEFIEPDVKGAVADELDVLPTDDLLRLGGSQPRVTGLHVGDFRGIQADGLADHRAPAFVEGLPDDIGVRPRRARRNHQRIGEPYTIDGQTQISHNDTRRLRG